MEVFTLAEATASGSDCHVMSYDGDYHLAAGDTLSLTEDGRLSVALPLEEAAHGGLEFHDNETPRVVTEFKDFFIPSLYTGDEPAWLWGESTGYLALLIPERSELGQLLIARNLVTDERVERAAG